MVLLTGIHFDATTEELEKALPFTKGGWKPFNTPLLDMKDLKPGCIGKIDWKPTMPMNNYLNMSAEEIKKLL